MTPFADLLRYLATAALGIFLGSQLTEGMVLLPWWRALAPEQFLLWYADNGQRLLGYFGPLTTATTLLAVAAASATGWAGGAGLAGESLAAILMIVVVASFFLYFERTNRGFATGTIAPGAVAAELERWSTWHWARTALAGFAFAASLVSA
ncbi:MAG TPA: hypothetical protein VGK20_01020 [Candidatus Binatia bacterium]|jgi:hypothetical protein